jgi:predicted RNA-binding Zn ribbon-like protein
MVTTEKRPENDGTSRVDSLDAHEEVAQRLRELNDSLIESSKAAGNTALDTYEKTLQALVHFEESVVAGNQLEWVSALAQAHAAFIRDTSTAYIEATRQLLSGDHPSRSATP